MFLVPVSVPVLTSKSFFASDSFLMLHLNGSSCVVFVNCNLHLFRALSVDQVFVFFQSNSKMSGHKCVYYNCELTSRQDPTIRKFSFPIRDPARCRQWILNSGNVALENLSPETLKKRFICSRHFSSEFDTSLRLPPNAVPLKYSHDTETTDYKEQTILRDSPKFTPSAVKSYPPAKKLRVDYSFPSTSKKQSSSEEENDFSTDKSWVRELINLPSVEEHEVFRKNKSLEEENKNLKEKLKIARKKINNLNTQLQKAKNKIKKIQLSGKPQADIKLLPDFSRSIVHMQLKSKKRNLWTSEEKRTALTIFYKGPATYKFLRRKGVTLPSVSTIKKWVGNFNCNPGINKKIFSNLKLKADAMRPFEKTCILLFDEMAIKKTLEYNRKLDIIEGFEDLGEFGRKPVAATQALVLMIRGIYSQWKLPIAYFVSGHGVTEASLSCIVKRCLKELRISGFNPIGITCDLAQINQKLFRELSVSIDQPYFYLDSMKYFAFFDVPHLLKCVRNNFIDNVFKINNKSIKFQDIKELYELDIRSRTGRSVPKLTETHLNPNSFQKMNVKLATQLFSHSVAAAIRTAVLTGQITSDTALDTAEFVEDMNNLFDALNSTRIHSPKPHNRALSEKNSAVLESINKGFDILKQLKKINRKGKETRPDSFDGFLITINAVMQFASEQRQKGFSYLLTGRLIQDPLENQFSVYRQKGGYNRNPTVRSFKSTFKMNIVHNLMRPPKGANAGSNPDLDENILNITNPCDTLSLLNVPETSRESPSSILDSSDSSMHSRSSVLLDNCAEVYFAGYLLKKAITLFNCEECRNILQSSEDIVENDELLIFFKNYELNNLGGLKYPTGILKKLTELGMKCFSKYIEKYTSGKIMLNIRRHFERKIHMKHPEWFECRIECNEHRAYIIDLLIRTLTYKYCKSVSDSLKTPNKTKNVKLTILKNA